jgi:hypothetical protein
MRENADPSARRWSSLQAPVCRRPSTGHRLGGGRLRWERSIAPAAPYRLAAGSLMLGSRREGH